tara:strand:- start:22 stop:462 length:441 start_codon:yes stop_codon:yes gene_type:complete
LLPLCFFFLNLIEKKKTRSKLQIEFENIENNLFINSYDSGYVIINKKKFRNLISINGNKIVQYDKPNNIYKNTFLDNLIKNADETKKKDLILFGTGVSVLNIPDEIKSFFYKNSVKFEIMNSLAAYKTYNILLHESRNFISIIKVL